MNAKREVVPTYTICKLNFNSKKVFDTPTDLVTVTVFMISRAHIYLLMIFFLSSCSLSSHPTPYKGKTELYIVGKGDTLAGIASRYNSSIDQLVALNSLDDPDALNQGQVLIVPANSKKIRSDSSQYSGGRLRWPVAGGYIISKFGPRESGFHDGLDIAAVTGTAVYAAHNGTVVYSGDELSGYGELVIVKSTSSLITVYAHNSKRLVSVGQKVNVGDQLAKVGETGHAEGPHLHFEVRAKNKEGRYVVVDPVPLLKTTEKATLKYRINESLSPLLAKLGSWTN